MHNRKNLIREKPKGKLGLIEERRRSEWDRGFRTKRDMVGGVPPEDSDLRYHDTREYNVDNHTRSVRLPTKTNAS